MLLEYYCALGTRTVLGLYSLISSIHYFALPKQTMFSFELFDCTCSFRIAMVLLLFIPNSVYLNIKQKNTQRSTKIKKIKHGDK